MHKDNIFFISGSIEDCKNHKYDFISKLLEGDNSCVCTSYDIKRISDQEDEVYPNIHTVIEGATLVIVDINKDLEFKNLEFQKKILSTSHDNDVPVFLLVNGSNNEILKYIDTMNNIRGKSVYEKDLKEVEDELTEFIKSKKSKVYQY